MNATKHTKGPVDVAEAGSWDSKGNRTNQEFFVRRPDDDIGIASDIVDPETGKPSEVNALFIAEAFNVATETGRTPRQLAEERAELLAACKAALDYLGTDNCGSITPRMQAAIARAEGVTP